MAYSPASSTFPTAKTEFVSPTATSDTGDFDHAGLETTQNLAITKLEDTVGITDSADTASLTYKLTSTSQSNPGHKHTLANGATDVTASKDELNVLDGIPGTLTATELGYVDGVTSAIQTQIDGKMSPTITAVPGSDHTVSGLLITLTAHENVAFGDVCYINSDGEAQLVDADAIATSNGIVMATATINANAAGTFLLYGIARDDTWNWTVGGKVYITVTGTSGNTLSQSAPTATDDVIQIVGVATHADRMLFTPQLVQVEHT